MNRLARLQLLVRARDDDGEIRVEHLAERDVAGDVGSIPYVVAELLQQLLRDAGADVYAQARAIATNAPRKGTG